MERRVIAAVSAPICDRRIVVHAHPRDRWRHPVAEEETRMQSALCFRRRRKGLHAIAVVGLAATPVNYVVLKRLLAMVETVRAGDPFVVAIVLVVVGLAALVPATRAALVEPMRVLRDQ